MLRPIDMNLTIKHAADANRVQGEGAFARPEHAQQMFSERLQREARQNEQQINQTHQAENNNINPDGRGNAGGYNRKRKPATPAKEDEKSKPKQAPRVGGSLFDISV